MHRVNSYAKTDVDASEREEVHLTKPTKLTKPSPLLAVTHEEVKA